MKYDFLIVGAGLYGATCAYELKKRGYKCLVIDKRNHIAGNIYTENIEGINVHKYGAHIFHTSDKKIWDYINQFAEFNNFINSPIARYKNKCYNLPFNMNTFTRLFDDVFTPLEAKQKIEAEKEKYHVDEVKNLKDQAINLVGKTVFETLIEGYTEKQWGRSCEELPAFIIKRLPVRFTYDNNYFNDIYQGIPKGGYTKIIEKMLDGIDVILNCDFKQAKSKFEYEKIIYTGPIDQYYDYCYGPLQYRSVEFRHEILDIDDYQGVAVVNYTDKEVPFTRIIEHKHFEFTKSDKTIISREYSSSWDVSKEPYYPINDNENNSLYEKYKALSSKENNIYFKGRLGQYKYYDMHVVLKEALDFINNNF